jgi:hypothetical protein
MAFSFAVSRFGLFSLILAARTRSNRQMRQGQLVENLGPCMKGDCFCPGECERIRYQFGDLSP